MSDFSEQVAFVTGASRGIGRRVAEDLAAHGAGLVITARSTAEIDQCAEDLRRRGSQALALPMDVSDPGQVKAAVVAALRHFGRIDILVNNAGITRDGLLMRMPKEDWRSVLSTNLDGVYHVTKQVLPAMMRQRYGRVINMSSVVAQAGNPGQANYVASKAGMIGLTKALACEVASRNITVNAIAPGFVETGMTAKLGDQTRQKLLTLIPLKRIGTVEDIAVGVRFLASKEAGYITGHVLNINGGMYM
ncbi:MAG: 3-oxoacyl-[acyl-carrier-protein] reductase [Acidobacteriota bacterium]